MYDLGDQARLAVEVKDLDGDLADSTLTLSLTLPDQTVVGPFTPTHDSLGVYHYDYTTVQAGRHVARWTGAAAAFAHTQVFDVESAADISIVSLTDVKTQLSMTSTANDDELRGYLLSASEYIEKACGPCAIRSFAQRLGSINSTALILAYTPVVSLTSITAVHPWSPAILTTDVTTDLATGIVTRLDGSPFNGPYDVTYKAGRAVIPSSLRIACLLIVQALWEARRGVVGVEPGGEEVVTLLNRADQLMSAFPAAAGFA